MDNSFCLKDKNILVTGASSGIGRSTAVLCAKMGASVIATGRNESRLKETVVLMDEVSESNSVTLSCDLSDFERIGDFVSKLPELNGVVLNAGIHKMIPIKLIKPSDIDEIFHINTTAQFLLFKELIKQKKITNGASVVFTASMAGLGECGLGGSLYAASKSAICSFAKSAAFEFSSKKIRVNTVCPGTTVTPMTENWQLFADKDDENLLRYPLGRYGEPADIANAMVFLLSDASSWITGIDLVIDGGMHLKR